MKLLAGCDVIVISERKYINFGLFSLLSLNSNDMMNIFLINKQDESNTQQREHISKKSVSRFENWNKIEKKRTLLGAV